MAKWPGVASGGGFDYVQDSAPSNPVEGEEWYDTSTDEAKVYTGSTWHLMSLTKHSALSGIGSSDHHARPVPGNALAEDANGNFDVQEGSIDHGNLAGITASDHHTRYSDSEADAVAQRYHGGALPKHGQVSNYRFTVVSDDVTGTTHSTTYSAYDTWYTVGSFTMDLSGHIWARFDNAEIYEKGEYKSTTVSIRLVFPNGTTAKLSGSVGEGSWTTVSGPANVDVHDVGDGATVDIQMMVGGGTDYGEMRCRSIGVSKNMTDADVK